MKQNTLETLLGFAVLAIALSFLFYSGSMKNKGNYQEYIITAKFDSVDGIIEGSDVQIAGIVVGKVAKLQLDPNTYSAIMRISLNKEVRVPLDSRASISSSGFLGGKYVSITPGGDDDMIKDGGQIKYTQSSINIESLIGKFMYSGGSSGSASSSSSSAPANNNGGNGNAPSGNAPAVSPTVSPTPASSQESASTSPAEAAAKK